jgi:ArsR family transcriptional regulator
MPSASSLHAEFFKAVGHPLRLRVLELLAEEERSVAAMLELLDVGQSSLSQQLSVLRRAGLVASRRLGSHVTYSLMEPRIADVLAMGREIQLRQIRRAEEQLEGS